MDHAIIKKSFVIVTNTFRFLVVQTSFCLWYSITFVIALWHQTCSFRFKYLCTIKIDQITSWISILAYQANINIKTKMSFLSIKWLIWIFLEYKKLMTLFALTTLILLVFYEIERCGCSKLNHYFTYMVHLLRTKHFSVNLLYFLCLVSLSHN